MYKRQVVDTVARRARKVQDKRPFPRLVAFGDDAETTHMEDRGGGWKKGPDTLPV